MCFLLTACGSKINFPTEVYCNNPEKLKQLTLWKLFLLSTDTHKQIRVELTVLAALAELDSRQIKNGSSNFHFL